jgi:diguanylate cyclase (GGDEF)-like protein
MEKTCTEKDGTAMKLRSPARFRRNPPKQIPFRLVLIVPFFLILCIAVGVIGFLAHYNSKAVVTVLANEVMAQAAQRIEAELDEVLATAKEFLTINRLALQAGDIDPKDPTALEHHLWQTVYTYSRGSLADLSFVAPSGQVVGVGRDMDGLISPPGSVLIVERNAGKRYYYLADSQGQRGAVAHIGPDWDSRDRDWYRQGVAQPPDVLTWTPVYAFMGFPLAAIRLVLPVYQADTLIGVLSDGFVLSELNDFLHNLNFSDHGQVFIMERSGELVATSTLEQPFVKSEDGENLVRLANQHSADALTQATAQALQGRSLPQTEDSLGFSFDENSERYFVQVFAHQAPGLDWLVALTVPERDFMAPLYQSRRQTLVLSGVAVLVTVLLGMMMAQWLTRPILNLRTAASAIAQDHFELEIPPSVISEITQLNRAMVSMAQRLQASFQALAESEAGLAQKVKERTQALEQANARLQQLSRTDALTQVANRGEFDRVLQQELQRHGRSQRSLALLLIDVDFFKRYNDCYGHLQGDACLVQVAQALQQAVGRTTDCVARYGGEEFVIILPETDTLGAMVVAQQVQRAISDLKLSHEASEVSAWVTVSMGLATMNPGSDASPEALITQADKALYQAKQQGRNRFVVFNKKLNEH